MESEVKQEREKGEALRESEKELHLKEVADLNGRCEKALEEARKEEKAVAKRERDAERKKEAHKRVQEEKERRERLVDQQVQTEVEEELARSNTVGNESKHTLNSSIGAPVKASSQDKIDIQT